jgi:hypothetical protein
MMERFVVGTGRCGSTLLSTMLAEHPDALVLSEFFGGVNRPACFPTKPLSGKQLASALSRGNLPSDYMRSQSIRLKESLHDMSSDMVDEYHSPPTIVSIALAFISKDPEGLWRELIAEVATWPVRTAHDHYIELFTWLQQRNGKKFWLERSGVSWEFFPQLRRTFPNAKFVHIHRDGLESALSMQAFPYFHVATSLFHDPPDRAEIEDIARYWNDRTDKNPLRRRNDNQPPTAAFGEYWSWQIEQGFSVVPKLNADQYLDVWFEDLLADPRATLTRIADFFEMGEAPGWMDKAIALMKPEVPSRFGSLPVEDQVALERACLDGNILLQRRPSRFFQSVLDQVEELRGLAPKDD